MRKRLVSEESYKEQNWEVALKKAFLGIDEDLLAGKSFPYVIHHLIHLLEDPLKEKESSGCTAIAALVTMDSKIYVVSPWNNLDPLFLHILQANAGDSRSVLSVKGKMKPLSFDHKPSKNCQYLRIYQATIVSHFAAEMIRIMKAGGSITGDRVNGMWIAGSWM